jgi:hypothetical protein
MLHVGHETVAKIMAWDVCRLGDADPRRREDKMRYITFLNDGPAARLGADPQTPDLVAVFTESVVVFSSPPSPITSAAE